MGQYQGQFVIKNFPEKKKKERKNKRNWQRTVRKDCMSQEAT